MCEKNFDGKALSLSSDDETDTIPKDWEEVKPSKKKRSRKKKKSKICSTCEQDIIKNKKRDMLIFKDTYHQMLAKDYCKNHETTHSNHKCKPHWCGDCGYLMKYEIEIQKGK